MNNDYTTQFAKIYDFEGQNNFSLNLFTNIMEYSDKNNITFSNHLDMACGTGAFCFQMYDKGINTEGIDISEGMIKVANENKDDKPIDFNLGNMSKYATDNRYDLISCNYDAINHLLSFEEWKEFFKNVYNNLEDEGYFLFDFNTLNKFKNFNASTYSTRNENFDSFFSVFPINDYQVVFRFVYYVLEENGMYSKVEQSVLESFFDTKQIFDELKQVGFKNIVLFDERFNPCNENSDSKRLYVFCQKSKQ